MSNEKNYDCDYNMLCNTEMIVKQIVQKQIQYCSNDRRMSKEYYVY